MNFYFIKTPKIIQFFYKNYLWNVKTNKKEIYLTFDDGPTPEVTQFVLDILSKYQAKATFFCIGKNIKNHPKIITDIITAGHTIGNHTHNHLNGWSSADANYVANVTQCQTEISKLNNRSNSIKLFRPPYGKIKKKQAKILIKKNYNIVMWSTLTGDFDSKLNTEIVLTKIKKQTNSGDIIVFHDTVKAYNNLKKLLPELLMYFTKQGYIFKKL